MSKGCQVVDIIPPELELLVFEDEPIKFDQPLTSNPNVGRFGQGDAEIVLKNGKNKTSCNYVGIRMRG